MVKRKLAEAQPTDTISMLASGAFNLGQTERTPEAIDNCWVKNQKWFLSTWDQIWKKEGLLKHLRKKDGFEPISPNNSPDNSSESSSDDEEVGILRRRVKELEEAIRILQPYKELDLQDNVWDEDKLMEDMEEARASFRKWARPLMPSLRIRVNAGG